MLAFIIRRIVWTIPVILLVILMTFLMMRLIKGNPFQVTDRPVPPSIQRNLDRKFHLDKPWWEQYLYYVRDIGRFDLGPSLVQRNQDVNDVIKEHFPTSIKLGLMAMAFAIVIGVPLGVFAALRHNTVLDYTAMGLANLGFAVPSFLVATLLIYFFALRLKDYTGLPTNGWNGPSSWVLPVIALGIYPMTYFARLVRGTVLETLQQDYIRTAKAKGLRWRVRRRQARAAELAHPGRHRGRPRARRPDHGVLHRGDDLRDPRYRQVLRDRGHGTGLLGRDGHHRAALGDHHRGEPGRRHPVRLPRPEDQR